MATALLIYVLAWRRGVTGYRVVPIGIGFTAALTAATHFLLTRAEITEVSSAMVWLTGSLNGRGWDQVAPVGVGLTLLGPAALAQGRGLRALQLGDDAARALGVRVELTCAQLFIAAVVLAALAAAAAGPVAFVALAAPPIAQRLAASGGLALVPALLTGACLVVGADLVAQHLLGGLPVGWPPRSWARRTCSSSSRAPTGSEAMDDHR